MLLKIHAIKNSSKHIQAGLSVIKAFQNGTENRILVPKRKIAPNENCDKQLKFFQHEKKGRLPTLMLYLSQRFYRAAMSKRPSKKLSQCSAVNV